MNCSICQRGGASPWERNTDGTYTHSACLHAHNLWPVSKGKKGNIYGVPPDREDAQKEPA